MSTSKRCPKCGSRSFQVVDHYITGYIYEVVDGHVIGDGADDGGAHIKTDCYCRQCGHRWHPRNLDEDFRIDE